MFIIYKMYVLYIFIVFIVFYTKQYNCETTIIVNTTNGPVRGLVSRTNTTENKTFYAFQGIPYAEPPTGNLRFRPPRWANAWNGTYNATSEGNMCLQSQDNKLLGCEDCLFLNIYTPSLAPKRPLATLFWIHGGGFVFGSGNLGLHGSDYFLLQDVIVVSTNYRLGVFGFLSTEDSSASGNWGLKDQILALKWIQKNIANFGGDPKNITIAGQSAGSASVNFLIESDRARGLFKGAIAESGTSLDPWSCARNARQLAFRIGIANFIITFSSKDLVERLRKVGAKQLLRSSGIPTILNLLDPLNGLPFAPVVEAEDAPDAVVTKFSYEARKNGQFNRVPFLSGFNSLEARIANKLPWYVPLLLTPYNFDPSKLTPEDMNASNEGNRIVGNNIKSYYFKNQSVSEGIHLTNFLDDNEFIRGIIKTSEFHSKYAKTYLYEFSFIGSIAHEKFQPEGASHGEELDFLFENADWKQNTSSAILTVKRMVGMWSNFAKYGDPTAIRSQAINVTWPLVNMTGCHPKALHYLDINVTLTPKTNPSEESMRLWDSWYRNYGYEPFNTY